ncbi:hypothetical protein [Microbacterium esteraromaticum]|uniref:hypothetical protein n=1 Tax=Microbacterium esteraromaticum TaxID=57043 RepID=UPI0019D32AD0|nr:hypothetical protein [Microbacterium esteraromaticum]MBN7793383.1 hypothetical protein [Microbacterium esteraromaticum]
MTTQRVSSVAIGFVVVIGIVASLVAMSVDQNQRHLTAPIIVQAIVGIFAIHFAFSRRSTVPLTLALIIAFELFRGCLVPLLIQVFGQDQPLYRQLGTYVDAASILWIGVAFFAAFTLTVMVRTILDGSTKYPPAEVGSMTHDVSTRGFAILAIAGMVGLVLRFPTIDSIQSFLVGNYDALQTSVEGGLIGFVSAVLRPLLPLSIALAIVRRKRFHGRTPWILWILLAGATFFSLGSYGLNRAAFLLPIIAFVVASTRYFGVKVRASLAVLVGVGAMLAFFTIGIIRDGLYAARMGSSLWDGASRLQAMLQTIILYGQSPLQSAPAVSEIGGATAWSLETLFNSVLSPIPGMPDFLRDRTGTALYNELLYQNTLVRDQIIPSWFEVFASGGVLFLIFFGMAVAMVAFALDNAFWRSRSLVGVYSATLATLICSQITISSITATLQNLIYFVMLPAGIAFFISPRRASRGGRQV